MAEENKFKCSGDCLNCRINPNERKTQWQYCAAQFTYNSMRMIESLHNELEVMTGTIGELKEKLEAIQNCEADVFNPNEEKPEKPNLIPKSVSASEDTAQEGDGAEE